MYTIHHDKSKLDTGWWLEHFSFFHILGIIIPTDELIFFRGVGQPPGCLLVGVFQVLQFSEMMVPTGMVWGHPDLR
jgi:hypothetical protein